MHSTMIGNDNNCNNNKSSGGGEKLKGERFVTHVNLSANPTETSSVSHHLYVYKIIMRVKVLQ